MRMRKVNDKKLEKEWEVATRYLPPHRRKDVDKNGRPLSIIYDSKTGRPTFEYRHPNFPLVISIVSAVFVVGKQTLLNMLQ